jgi:hypothetical protein
MLSMAAAVAALALHAIPGTALKVGVPTGWRVVDSTVAASIARKEATQFPQLAGLLGEVARKQSPLRFVMYDPHRTAGFVTNANVVVDKSPRSTLDQVVNLELTGLAQALDPTNFSQHTTRIAGRRAVSVSFRAALDDPSTGKKTTVYDRQVYFLDGKHVYVVTLTTLPRELHTQGAVIDAIVRSLTFGQ